MKNQQQRLKAVELSLTPSEVVLLWMKNSLASTYEERAFKPPRPRGALANSVATVVRNSLKDEPDAVLERAILQARQEADELYMIVVEVNSQIHQQFFELEREYLFLLGYFSATLARFLRSVPEEQVRALTLLFVNQILVLESAVSQISAGKFASHPILFSDSAVRLKEQGEMADEALRIFNSIAEVAGFQTLNKEEIVESLTAAIDLKVSRLRLLAHAQMLAVFGAEGEFRENCKRLATAGEESVGGARRPNDAHW